VHASSSVEVNDGQDEEFIGPFWVGVTDTTSSDAIYFLIGIGMAYDQATPQLPPKKKLPEPQLPPDITPTFSANSCAALFEPPTCETFPRHPRPITGS
jgi:hypothetical protein